MDQMHEELMEAMIDLDDNGGSRDPDDNDNLDSVSEVGSAAGSDIAEEEKEENEGEGQGRRIAQILQQIDLTLTKDLFLNPPVFSFDIIWSGSVSLNLILSFHKHFLRGLF
jgi:hypothetical protein